MATEAPRTAIARIRIFIQKGLGTPMANNALSYFYDQETGQAHLTLYGRAFAFASQERNEADAKEGVHRAALCRDILHTILKTFPPDRIQKFDLQRLAVEWQSMATLGPLPSKIPPPPASLHQAGQPYVPTPPRNTHTQTSSSYSPQAPGFLPPGVAARTIGNHSIVSPSTSTQGLSPASTSHTTLTSDLPPLDRRITTGLFYSQPSTFYPQFPAPSTSKASQGVQPVLPPSVPVQAPAAPAAMRVPVSTSTTFNQATSASTSRTRDYVEDDEPPDVDHPDETRPYRSLLRAKVPDTAVKRIKWLCAVHLSRGRNPQVYKPYLDFHIEDRTARLIVAARSGEPCELRLEEDELYLKLSNRGREWLKEALARQAIKNGIFTKFTKMKMPKANVKSEMFAIVRDYCNLKTLKPNRKPTRSETEGVQAERSPAVSSSARPAIAIASSTAIPPPHNGTSQNDQTASRGVLGPAAGDTSTSQPRDLRTPSTGVSMAFSTTTSTLPSSISSDMPKRSDGVQQTLPQLAVNGEVSATVAAAKPPIDPTNLPLRTSASPGTTAASVSNADLATNAGRSTGLEGRLAEGVDLLPNQVSHQPSASRDPRRRPRVTPPVMQANDALIAAEPQLQEAEAPTPTLADASRSLPPLERPNSFPPTPEVQTHEISEKNLVDRTALAPRTESAVAYTKAVMIPEYQSSATTDDQPDRADRQKPVRTPSLSERMAQQPQQSPATTLKDQSLLARMQSDESASGGPSQETQIPSSSQPSAGERIVEVSLLDRLADREAELRRRMRAARRAPEQTVSRNETTASAAMQVDIPAAQPTEETRNEMASIAAIDANKETRNATTDIIDMDVDRQEASQDAGKLPEAAERRASKDAVPEERDTIPAPKQPWVDASAAGIARRVAHPHEILKNDDTSTMYDQLVEKERLLHAAEARCGDAEPLPVQTATAEETVPLGQAVTSTAQASSNVMPPSAVPIVPATTPQQAVVTENGGAEPPGRSVETEEIDAGTAPRLNKDMPRTAEASARSENDKQVTHTATLPTRPRSGSLHSTYSGRSRGSRPETEAVNVDGRNKRRRDSGNGQFSAYSHGSIDDDANKRSRSSPGPLGSNSYKSVVSSVSNAGDSRPSTPSSLYSVAQSMASILAKLAEGALTYDQACEAMYALSLPASLDSAAFEALEAIWANSSAQLLQQVSANFGMNCKSSDLVLMPKAWVQESMELLQKESSAS